MVRLLIRLLSVLSLVLAVSACGAWRGANDVSTDYGSDAMGNGPGLVTGKQGGIVIFQK